jgi:RNA polymerase sigma factor (sigma-70 family)
LLWFAGTKRLDLTTGGEIVRYRYEPPRGWTVEPMLERSDADIMAAVRAGDESAFGLLWQRHEMAALRLARQISSPSNAEDLVSEAFARVLRALRQGAGPDGGFRPYLCATLRNINIDTGRSYHQRVTLTDDEAAFEGEPAASAADVVLDNDLGRAAWLAWASLPATTRTLLWHLVVEDESPAQIAPLLGTTPNGVSSRAVRARERLRQAFLQQQLAEAPQESCRRARRHFGAYVRDALSARDRAQVEAHLRDCEAGCAAALFEVNDVNETLRAVIAPLVLGGGAVAGYLAAARRAGGGSGAPTAAHGSRTVSAGLRATRGAARAPVRVLIGVVVAVIATGGVALAQDGRGGTDRLAAADVTGTPTSGSSRPPAAPPSSVPPARSGSAAPSIVTRPSGGTAPGPASLPVIAPAGPAVRTTTSTPRPARPSPSPSPAQRPARRPTQPPTPTQTQTPTAPATVATGTVVTTPPPAPVVLTQTDHFAQPGDSSTGTYTVTIDPSEQLWSIDALTMDDPTAATGTTTTCSVAPSGRTASCVLVAPVAGTTYPVTLTVRGPSDDHDSTMTISYASANGSAQNPPVVINPTG